MEVTRTKFFVVNGISILSLWNIQLTFEQEVFRRNERYRWTPKSARITLVFQFLKFDKKLRELWLIVEGSGEVK